MCTETETIKTINLKKHMVEKDGTILVITVVFVLLILVGITSAVAFIKMKKCRDNRKVTRVKVLDDPALNPNKATSSYPNIDSEDAQMHIPTEERESKL